MASMVALQEMGGGRLASKDVSGSRVLATAHLLPEANADLSDLVRRKPSEALRLAAQLGDVSARNDLFRRGIAEWSARDGNAALRWIAQLENAMLRDELRSIALVQFSSYDPTSAVEALEELLPQGAARDKVLVPIYQRWAEINPGAARASASALADSAERTLALEQIARQLSSEDPSGAIRLLIEEDLADSSQDLLEELATRWGVLDHVEARRWIELLGEGEARDRLLKRVATAVARDDPREAASWVLGGIPPGMTQDEAVLAVLGEWLLSDIDAASEWATTFSPGPLLSQAEEKVREARMRRMPP